MGVMADSIKGLFEIDEVDIQWARILSSKTNSCLVTGNVSLVTSHIVCVWLLKIGIGIDFFKSGIGISYK